MQLWPVAHFFLHFVTTFGWVQQQSNSKPTQKWWQNEKKWATGQSCIREEVTSYKIHTLEIHPVQKFWPLFNANNIFLALVKFQIFFNIILHFSYFARGH